MPCKKIQSTESVNFLGLEVFLAPPKTFVYEVAHLINFIKKTLHYKKESLDYVLASTAKRGHVACAKMKMEMMLPKG